MLKQIEKLQFDDNEIILFLARLLYPSYYFDMYDKIIQEKIREEKINYYVKKNISYEIFLKQIYNYLKQIYKLPQIEWLEN